MGDIKYLFVLGLYFGAMNQFIGFTISMFVTAVFIIMDYIIKLIKREDKSEKVSLPKELSFGFYLGIGFTIVMLLQNGIL